MAKDQIIIEFKARGNKALTQAIRELDNATRSLQGRAKKYADTSPFATKSNRLLSNSFATLRSQLLLVNFAMAMGVRQIGQYVQEAAKIDNMSRAFNTLSGGGENATIAMDRLQEATNNTMSQFDLFQQANNAMVLGITKNSDEMAEMFDIAQRLGRALGRDTASSVESLITGIGRQSRLMLDNIGIIVKAEEAYEAYANKLGKTADALTDTEKKTAFLEATMISAREKVARLGDEVLSTQDRLDQLSTATSNATVALGNLAIVALNLDENIPKATNRLKAWTEFIDTKTKPSVQSLNIVMKDLIVNLLGTSGALGTVLMKLHNQLNPVKEAIKEIGQSHEILPEAIGQTNLSLLDLIPSLTLVEELYSKSKEGQIALIEAQMAQIAADGMMLDSNKENAVLLERMGIAYDILAEKYEKLTGKSGDREKSIIGEINATGRLLGALSQLAAGNKQTAIMGMQLAKGAAVASAISGSMKAFEKGGVAGFLTGTALLIEGMARVQQINAQIKEAQRVPKFARGGIIGGRRHSQGGTMIEAEQGEYVMRRDAVDSIGIENLNRMNNAGGMGSAVTVNISGNVMSSDYVEGELAEQIKDAVRRGTDFGIV